MREPEYATPLATLGVETVEVLRLRRYILAQQQVVIDLLGRREIGFVRRMAQEAVRSER